MANSADPDQLAFLQKPTDLGLHCLQKQDISGFSRTRVNLFVMQWNVEKLKMQQKIQSKSDIYTHYNVIHSIF